MADNAQLPKFYMGLKNKPLRPLWAYTDGPTHTKYLPSLRIHHQMFATARIRLQNWGSEVLNDSSVHFCVLFPSNLLTKLRYINDREDLWKMVFVLFFWSNEKTHISSNETTSWASSRCLRDRLWPQNGVVSILVFTQNFSIFAPVPGEAREME